MLQWTKERGQSANHADGERKRRKGRPLGKEDKRKTKGWEGETEFGNTGLGAVLEMRGKN